VFYLLLTLLIIVAILLMVVVLLQAGKGGGLAAMGGAGAGTDTLFGGRQAATLLTRSSWWLGGLFMGLALALSILSSRGAGPDTILRGEFENAPRTAPAPTLPGLTPGQEGSPAVPQGTATPGPAGDATLGGEGNP
jgi:preprotein translocase subunit SecG